MSAETSRSGGFILIVEDDAGVSELEAQRLAPLGLALKRARGAEEARAAIAAGTPELLLIDYSLPGASALDFVAGLKRDGVPVPPFIVVTGRGDEAVAVEAMKAGASDYIVKNADFLERLLPAAQKTMQNAALLKELQSAQESTAKNLRLYTFLSQVNLAAAQAKDRETLFRRICEVAVEAGGMRMAWVGAPDLVSGLIKPVSQAGFTDDYLEGIKIEFSGDSAASKGPTGTTARTGAIRTCPDISVDPAMAPWREKALARGYRSSAAIPLMQGGDLAAILSLYSAQPLFFTGEELKLLGEIKANISLSLDALTAAEELESQRRLFSDVIDNSPSAIYAFDRNGRFMLANKAVADIFHTTPEKLVGKTRKDLIPEEYAEKHRLTDLQIFETGLPVASEETTPQPDGVHQYYSAKFPLKAPDGSVYGICGISTDITERKNSEREARLNEARLESLVRINAYPYKSIQDLLDYALSEAIKLTESRLGYIYFYSEEKKEFTLNTWSKEVMKECAVVNPQTKYQLEKTGLWGEAVRQRKPVVINDFSAPNPLKKGYPAGHAELKSFMTIPVMSGQTILAVVGVANRQTPYTDADIRQLGLLMDSVWKIVERRENQQKVAAKEKEYAELFNNMLDGVALHEMIYDAAGNPRDYRFVSVNSAFEKMLGVTKEQVEGHTLREIMPGVSPFWITTYSAVVSSGRPIRFCREEKKLGKHFEVLAIPAGGAKFAAFFQDITDREEALRRLSESEERFKNLLDSSPDGIMVRRGREIIYANASALRLAGEASLTGRDPLSLLPPELREKFSRRIDLVDGTGEKTPPLQIQLPRPDGRQAELEVSGAPLIFGGEKCGMILLRDISERKQAERMLQEMASMQRVESLGALAGGIAHDFNNMLTGIIANLSLLGARGAGGKENAEIIGEAMDAARNAQHLTSQLLSFSKGGKPVKKEICLETALGEIFSLAKRGASAGTSLELQPGLWSVEADRSQLLQAVNNLLINGLQAMPAGGVLKLAASNVRLEKHSGTLPPGMYVRVSVSDTGIGIPKEYVSRLFEPYFTTKSTGHGLGLSMTYSVVKNHGGEISVYSEPGRGTTFELLLPATGRALPADRRDAGPVVKGSGRVLALEDEDIISKVLGRMLTELGYTLTLTRDGAETVRIYAEELAAGRPYSAVIMDLTIPGGMGGKDAVAKLRAIAPDIPVIVSSGYSDEAVMANFRDYGFDAVLPKPYDFEELSALLSRLVKKR